jgi:hypothetical protein
MLSEIQSHLKRAQETLGSYHLYISGGEAPLFQPFLPQPLTFVPNLTLIGVWHWQNFLFRGLSLTFLWAQLSYNPYSGYGWGYNYPKRHPARQVWDAQHHRPWHELA